MGFFSRLFGGGARFSSRPTAPPITVIGTRTKTGKRAVRVKREPRALHEEKGWQQVGDTLRGRYRVGSWSFEGRVEEFLRSSRRFIIVDPPEALLNGPHSPCFRPRSEGVYEVHWAYPPEDASAGIVTIEENIAESLR